MPEIQGSLRTRRTLRTRAMIAALALLVIAEAGWVGLLLYRSSRPAPAARAIVIESLQPGADVLVDGKTVGITPFTLQVGADMRSIRVVSREPAGPPGISATPIENVAERQTESRSAIDPREANGLRRGAAPQQEGAVMVSSPIDLQVLEGGRVLGSSADGRIRVAAGRHEFELVNSALGVRSRYLVDVEPGQTVPLEVLPPNGRLSINALPWADVWIDGNPVGQTPLGNLLVPVGEHEIVFRHPQLGERRQVAVVKLDGLTRVSANLQ